MVVVKRRRNAEEENVWPSLSLRRATEASMEARDRVAGEEIIVGLSLEFLKAFLWTKTNSSQRFGLNRTEPRNRGLTA